MTARTEGGYGRALRWYSGAILFFLFVPIAVVVVFSFNQGRHVAELTGFSFDWYREAWTNPFVLRALRTSLGVAFAAATISTILGTTTAIVMPTRARWIRVLFGSLVNMAIVVPSIVLGISLLIAVVGVTTWLNEWINYLWPASDFRAGLGIISIIIGHSVFGTAIVHVLVRTRLNAIDPAVLEASADLYAQPLPTIRHITLPLLRSAIVAGFLLAFVFSFDDFIVAFFTRGQATTLPIFLFSSIRRGVTPVINATASTLMVFSLCALAVAAAQYRRRTHGISRGDK